MTADNAPQSAADALLALRQHIARAIHRYDNEHALSGNDIPGAHHLGEADAVLQALEDHLNIGETEAWCKVCLRVWEGRTHTCDRIPALDDARAESARLGDAVEALRNFNELTYARSSRAQARVHARDNLALLDGILGTPPDIPATSRASSAREDLLNEMAQWGLTTGRGSRQIADRILNRRAHEAAEELRAWVAEGDAGADEYGSAGNVLEGADRIDPEV